MDEELADDFALVGKLDENIFGGQLVDVNLNSQLVLLALQKEINEESSTAKFKIKLIFIIQVENFWWEDHLSQDALTRLKDEIEMNIGSMRDLPVDFGRSHVSELDDVMQLVAGLQHQISERFKLNLGDLFPKVDDVFAGFDDLTRFRFRSSQDAADSFAFVSTLR